MLISLTLNAIYREGLINRNSAQCGAPQRLLFLRII